MISPSPTTQADIKLNGQSYKLAPVEDAYRETQDASDRIILDEEEQDVTLPRSNPFARFFTWSSWHRGVGLERRRPQGTRWRYNYAFGYDARYEGRLSRGPLRTNISVTGTVATAAACVDFFEIGGNLFSVHGRHIIQINTATDAVTDAEDFGVGVACTDTQEFDGRIYAALGSSTLQSSANGTTWAAITGTINADYLAEHLDRMWVGRGNDLRAVAGAATDSANYTATVDVDSSGQSITSIAPWGTHVIIGKTNGLWQMDQGIDQALIPQNLLKWVASFTEVDNGKKVGEWNGMALFPNVTGLAAFRSGFDSDGISQMVGPESYPGNSSPAQGKCTAWTAFGAWMFASFLNAAGDSYICAGRLARSEELSVNPERLIIWHTIDRLTATTCSAMHITHITTNPRLYIGRGSEVSYYILPRYGTSALNESGTAIDTTVRFATGGEIYLEVQDGFAPSTTKVYEQASIELLTVNATDYPRIEYRIDGVSWRTLGNPQSGPRATFYFPQGTAGYRIEMRLVDQGTDTTRTYIVTNLTVNATARIKTSRIIKCKLLLENSQMHKSGVRDQYVAPTLKDRLTVLAEGTTQVTMISPYGEELLVEVLPPVVPVLLKKEHELATQWIVEIMAQVTFEPGDIMFWDLDFWDAGKVWA